MIVTIVSKLAYFIYLGGPKQPTEKRVKPVGLFHPEISEGWWRGSP